jgi:hypothetical protein
VALPEAVQLRRVLHGLEVGHGRAHDRVRALAEGFGDGEAGLVADEDFLGCEASVGLGCRGGGDTHCVVLEVERGREALEVGEEGVVWLDLDAGAEVVLRGGVELLVVDE